MAALPAREPPRFPCVLCERSLSLSLPLPLILSLVSLSAEADSSRLAGAEAAGAAATQLDIQAAWLAPLLPSLAAATASPAAQTSVLWLFLPNALGVSERTLNSEVGEALSPPSKQRETQTRRGFISSCGCRDPS